eukprot:6182358-Pleurochrysis_carterae.AAC.3
MYKPLQYTALSCAHALATSLMYPIKHDIKAGTDRGGLRRNKATVASACVCSYAAPPNPTCAASAVLRIGNPLFASWLMSSASFRRAVLLSPSCHARMNAGARILQCSAHRR